MGPIRWINLNTVLGLIAIAVLVATGDIHSGDISLVIEGFIAYIGLVVLWSIPRGGFRRRVKLVMSRDEQRARRKLGKFDYTLAAGVLIWEIGFIALSPKGTWLGYVGVLAPLPIVIVLYSRRSGAFRR